MEEEAELLNPIALATAELICQSRLKSCLFTANWDVKSQRLLQELKQTQQIQLLSPGSNHDTLYAQESLPHLCCSTGSGLATDIDPQESAMQLGVSAGLPCLVRYRLLSDRSSPRLQVADVKSGITTAADLTAALIAPLDEGKMEDVADSRLEIPIPIPIASSSSSLARSWKSGALNTQPQTAAPVGEAMASTAMHQEHSPISSMHVGAVAGGAQLRTQHNMIRILSQSRGCVRLFIAGDRTHCGKTTLALGLLGSLLRQGVPASRLGYIKPATQCEAPDLLQAWCKANGIAHVEGADAPLVFFKGFTRGEFVVAAITHHYNLDRAPDDASSTFLLTAFLVNFYHTASTLSPMPLQRERLLGRQPRHLSRMDRSNYCRCGYDGEGQILPSRRWGRLSCSRFRRRRL